MTTLSTAEVNAIFDEHEVKFPSLRNQIGELKTYYTTKMWHQMTDCMVAYVKNSCFDSSGDGNELIVFYEKLVQKLNFRLNPIKYAIITILCSRQFEAIEDAIKFLETSKDRLKGSTDALFLLEIS
jgi:SUMO ligase MMS21 Smc5/6 complex component